MDKLTFSRDSWHYWFIRKTTTYFSYSRVPDICSYTRAFIAGLLKTLFLGSFASAVATSLLSTLAWWLSKMFHFSLPKWVIGFGHVGVIILIVVTVIAGVCCMIALQEHIQEKRAARGPKPPGAIKEMYSSWKNKTCKQIEFT